MAMSIDYACEVLDEYDNNFMCRTVEDVAEAHDLAIRILKNLLKTKTCVDCILDLTDACPRGAGRAIDDEICGDFMQEVSISEDKEIHSVIDGDFFKGI